MTPKLTTTIILWCAAAVLLFCSPPSAFAADSDAMLQQASTDYAAMLDSLVKKYEEQYKRGEELDHKYRQANNKDTIRNQVAAWQSIVTDGYNAMFGFLKSEDFDKAAIINTNYHFNQALRMPIGYKDSWSEEIGPAYSAVQRCCSTDDINECSYQILQKAFPYYRDFANKIEEQVAGFFRSVDQSKLGYYDDYYKKKQTFTYTWPDNVKRLLNFFKGKNYDQELQSWKISGSHFQDPSLLTVDMRSNEGRLLVVYVNMEVQNYSSASPENFWLHDYLEDVSVIAEGGNYLVLNRENSFYRLIHFYKGRKSLAVVYTIDTDQTVDAMVRYLILALRDYVVSGAASGPAPQPDEGPAPAPAWQMEVDPLTSTNLRTSPGAESTCTLQVTVADPKGALAANAAVVFEKPTRGTLSALQLATDAQGQARVTYTAPTEDQMAQAGKKEASVTLTAREQKSGARGSVTLNIRSRTSTMTSQVEHAILPAHHKYYNTIRFRFQAANKKDGSPYQARITAHQQWGALVKDKLQQGGTPTYTMAVWPNSDCAVAYHWVGPASMMKAADEIITVEIPELGLKKEVTFSVGIDLAIVSVKRAYGGALLPLLWEPFHITITDRFHPDADLAALLEQFHITTDLEIEQTFYSPPPVAPGDTGFLSALLTTIEGSAQGALRDAVIWDAGGWGVQKQQDKRCILIQKGQYEDGSPWIEYPAIVFWERGSYQFQVTLKPGPVDADPRTNLALTEVYTIEDFRGMSDEVIHTVFLPSIEFVAGALAGYAEGLPIKFAFCLKGLAGDIHSGSYTGFMLDAWGCGMDVIGASKLPARVKELFDDHLLALYAKTLCDTLVANAPQPTAKGAPGGTRADAPAQAPPQYDLAKVLEVAHVAVKGCKETYLVILEREGLGSYAGEVAGLGALTPALAKVTADQSPAQRIEEGERFVVIPAHTTEKLTLRLSGSGGKGELIVVTPDSVKRYSYPAAAWQSTVAIDNTGQAAATQGAALAPVP